MTDAVLIEQYLNGNVQAFNTLVWRWQSPVYNFVLRVIGNSEQAKDITQATFIRVFKDLKKLKDKEKFKSWLYRIAMNLCLDEIKKMKKRKLVYLNSEFDYGNDSLSPFQIPDDENKTPESLMQHNQIKYILKEALQQIPEEQRVVVIMKQYQDLKFTEIAQILKEPVNTVKSRLYYGLKALKKHLEGSSLNKEVLFNEM